METKSALSAVSILFVGAMLTACGGGSEGSSTATTTPQGTTTPPISAIPTTPPLDTTTPPPTAVSPDITPPTTTPPDNSPGTSYEQPVAGTGRLAWVARYNGPGNAYDSVEAMAVDSVGNVYVTGASNGPNNFSVATIKYDTHGNRSWVARYENETSSPSIAVDGEGNVYVTSSLEISSDKIDYATIKYDPNGNELWVATYSGLGGVNWATKLSVDVHGNVYVTGYSQGLYKLFGYATVKYDTNGNQLWAARFHSSIPSPPSETGISNSFATDLAVDANGNVYVTGYVRGAGGEVYATIKYDQNGNQLWDARYLGGSLRDNKPAALAVDSMGNVYVTGSSDDASTSSDYATIKYDANGAQLWVVRHTNGEIRTASHASALALDRGGNVYVTGTSFEGASLRDFDTIKYDTNGNQLWAARYNGPGNGDDIARSLAVDPAGNVFVLGYSAGLSNPYDFAMIKYDSNGNQLWVERYVGAINDNDLSLPTALALDGADNVYVAGRTQGADTYSDFVTIKYLNHNLP